MVINSKLRITVGICRTSNSHQQLILQQGFAVQLFQMKPESRKKYLLLLLLTTVGRQDLIIAAAAVDTSLYSIHHCYSMYFCYCRELCAVLLSTTSFPLDKKVHLIQLKGQLLKTLETGRKHCHLMTVQLSRSFFQIHLWPPGRSLAVAD